MRFIQIECAGISFVDSTPLRVCHNQRIHMHKTFEGLEGRGKCSMGWFFGFKLHLICPKRQNKVGCKPIGKVVFPSLLATLNSHTIAIPAKISCLFMSLTFVEYRS